MPGGNNIIEFPIKVVNLYWDGNFLGRTSEDTEKTDEAETVEIFHQQEGSGASDEIFTGSVSKVIATFSDVDTELIDRLNHAFKLRSSGNSAMMQRQLFRSMLENARPLEARAIDEHGDSTVDPTQIMVFPKAYPKIISPLIFGIQTQRTIQVEFRIFWDEIRKLYWYMGYASSLGISGI